MFSVEYFGKPTIEFRRHNDSNGDRFRIIPKYRRVSGDTLPSCPVIYLGLSRLFPFGEVSNDSSITSINKNLPASYNDEIINIYNKLTFIQPKETSVKKVGALRNRVDFTTNKQGIDSNTISSGEDNLYTLLTAILSLRYYYDTLNNKTQEVESVLLIDELDATLHPHIQIELLNILIDYSAKYKIQIFFTSHSFVLIEEALKKKLKTHYLINNVSNISVMEEVDIYKIKLFLHNKTRKDLFSDKKNTYFY